MLQCLPFFGKFLKEWAPTLDIVGRRYGKLPSQLIRRPLDTLGLDMAVALLGAKYENEVRAKAAKKEEDEPSIESMLGKSGWSAPPVGKGD